MSGETGGAPENPNWAAYSHRELYDAVHNNNRPAEVAQLAGEWRELSARIEASSHELEERLRASAASWRGDAGKAARVALDLLVDWNRTVSGTAAEVAGALGSQGKVMENAKNRMPEPVAGAHGPESTARETFASGGIAGFAAASGDLRARQAEATEAHQRAVRVLDEMRIESATVQDRTPQRFQRPPDPIEGLSQPRPESARPQGAQSPSPAGTDAASAAATGAAAAETQQIRTADLGPASTRSASAPPVPDAAAARAAGPQATTAAASGIDGPTRALPKPTVMRPTASDQPTARSGPVNSANGPTRRINTRDLGGPEATRSQSAGAGRAPGEHEQDRRHRPGGQQDPQQHGGSAPNRPNKDKRNRRGFSGKIPRISETGAAEAAPGGPMAAGSSGTNGGEVPPVPSGGAGGAAGEPLSPGGSSGSGEQTGRTQAPQSGNTASGSPASGSGMAGMGGMGPMGGAARGGQGDGDKERTSKYVEGGPVVEAPGADLPPPVIGESRKRKRREQE